MLPHSTIKVLDESSVFWQDCDNAATILIGTRDDGAFGPPTNIEYVGTCSIVDQGIWVDYGGGLWWVGDRMNWQIKGTVYDTETGEEWKLYWHFGLRDGEFKENYKFEPME